MNVTSLVVRWAVFAFSLLVLYAGIAPLLFPGNSGSTSSAPAYAVFHVIAATVGLILVFWAGGVYTAWFALAFGLIDLYQALASRLAWFPKEQFQWTPTDDLLHLVLGLALVALGTVGLLFSGRAAA